MQKHQDPTQISKMRFRALFPICALVLMVSCSDDTVTTDPGALTGAAATVTNEHVVNEAFEFEELFIPCANGGAGELVNFTGVLACSTLRSTRIGWS